MYRYYYFQSESLSPSWLGNKQDSPCSQQCPFPSLVRPLLVTSRYMLQAGVNRSGPSWIFWSNLTLQQGCPTAAVVGMGKMGGEGERKRGMEDGRRFFHIMFPLSTQEKRRAFEPCCNCIFFTALTGTDKEDASFHTPLLIVQPLFPGAAGCRPPTSKGS